MKKVNLKTYPYMITEVDLFRPMPQEEIIGCNEMNAAFTKFIKAKIAAGGEYNDVIDSIVFTKAYFAKELAVLKEGAHN